MTVDSNRGSMFIPVRLKSSRYVTQLFLQSTYGSLTSSIDVENCTALEFAFKGFLSFLQDMPYRSVYYTYTAYTHTAACVMRLALSHVLLLQCVVVVLYTVLNSFQSSVIHDTVVV